MKEIAVSLWEISQDEAVTLPPTVPVLAYNKWTKNYSITYNEKGSFIKDVVSSRHIVYFTFDDVSHLINRVASGRLYKNTDGRYAINDDVYFTAGDSIEIFFGKGWLLTRIEHNGKDYFAVDLQGMSLTGLTARLPQGHQY